ncbi:MAG: hypothetical protein D6E12_04425 [Desulfovibrio sp.]|nr:MAG: hypothetical protein D6E12_04425 [Desulfovibrio sp.]
MSYDFEIDQKKEFYDNLHANILEHGLWFCKNATELYNSIMKQLIVDYNLPYDAFDLHKKYVGMYNKIVATYMKLFLFSIFDTLESSQIRTKEELIAFMDKGAKEPGVENEFTETIVKLLNDDIHDYLRQFYKRIKSEESLEKYVSHFEKRIRADILLNIDVSLQFFKSNVNMLLEYLNELYEKNFELEDVLGRCLFKLLEDKYSISVYFNGTSEIQYFHREFGSPFLEIIKNSIFGMRKYYAANNYLKRYIRSLLKRNVQITKYSFPIFFNDEKFKEHFCNYLMVILQAIQAYGRDELIIRDVNAELKKQLPDFPHTFLPEHFYIMVDCWSEFLGQHSPDLLKRVKEPVIGDSDQAQGKKDDKGEEA